MTADNNCNTGIKFSPTEETEIKKVVRKILSRRLRGTDNIVLRELVVTEVAQTFLDSLYENGFVSSFEYGLEINPPRTKEAALSQ